MSAWKCVSQAGRPPRHHSVLPHCRQPNFRAILTKQHQFIGEHAVDTMFCQTPRGLGCSEGEGPGATRAATPLVGVGIAPWCWLTTQFPARLLAVNSEGRGGAPSSRRWCGPRRRRQGLAYRHRLPGPPGPAGAGAELRSGTVDTRFIPRGHNRDFYLGCDIPRRPPRRVLSIPICHSGPPVCLSACPPAAAPSPLFSHLAEKFPSSAYSSLFPGQLSPALHPSLCRRGARPGQGRAAAASQYHHVSPLPPPGFEWFSTGEGVKLRRDLAGYDCRAAVREYEVGALRAVRAARASPGGWRGAAWRCLLHASVAASGPRSA